MIKCCGIILFNCHNIWVYDFSFMLKEKQILIYDLREYFILMILHVLIMNWVNNEVLYMSRCIYILSCVSVKSFGWFTIEIQLVVVNVGLYVLWFGHVIIMMRLKGFNDLNNKKIYKFKKIGTAATVLAVAPQSEMLSLFCCHFTYPLYLKLVKRY